MVECSENGRAIFAFMAAPLAAGFVLVAPSYFTGQYDFLQTLLATLIVSALAALPTAVIGLPAYLALNRFRLVNFCTILLGGLLTGAGATLVVRSPGTFYAPDLSPFLLAGALSACVFWAIWRPRSAE